MKELFVLLAAILLFSCTGEEETGKSTIEKKDTVITLSKDGQQVEISIPGNEPYMLKELHGIDSVMKAYKGKPLEKEVRTAVDVTGDGVPEELIAYTYIEGDTCKVSHTIRSAGNFIWTDFLSIDDSWGELAFNDTTTYRELFPYSAFYAGLGYLPVIADDKTTAASFADNEVTLALFRSLLKEKGIEGDKAEEELESYKEYLRNYKGRLVCELDMMDGGLYIWYEPGKEFILLYAP